MEPLNLQNGPAAVLDWIDQYEMWASVQKSHKADNPSNLFLTIGGKELISLMKGLAAPEHPSKVPVARLKELLIRYTVPTNFTVTERAKFYTMVRGPNVSFRQYILELQKQASKCEFAESLQEHLRDRLVSGVNCPELQRRMLDKADITYAEACQMCEAHEDLMANTAQNTVLFQKMSITADNRQHAKHRPAPNQHRPRPTQSKEASNPCMSCGGHHDRSACRFRTAKCHACGRIGHLRRVCRKKTCNVTTTEASHDEDDVTNCPVYSLSTSSRCQQFIYHELSFPSGARHTFIVDTGSAESVIPAQVLSTICPDAQISATSVQLHGVTGHRLHLLGEVILPVLNTTSATSIRFLVASDSPSILGLHAMRQLDHTITLQTTDCRSGDLTNELRQLTSKCSDIHGGMNIPPVHLEADGDPVFLKRRIIPYGQRDGVLQALERMQTNGTITSVQSSAWATPIVIAMKADGRTPRICGDYRLTLNPKLKRCAATTMEPEDILKLLDGAHFFSTIDLADAYLQIPLTAESKKLTTINTPWGLFQFNFLPFGLHVSSGIFQSAIDHVIRELPGVCTYQDDVIVYGNTKSEHDANLLNLLRRFVHYNVAIKPSKCTFGAQELNFLGFSVSSRGYRPCPSRFQPLVQMPSPANPAQLRSIMGCVQYYSRFIPNFATRAQPLFALQTADDWDWTPRHEAILRELLNVIATRPCLAPFSPTKRTVLITDASEVGVGAIIEQDGHPVICISRLLNKAERGYSQTQKEALAVFWAVRRLHKYLIGLKFVIMTDHQALAFLFNPNKSVAKSTAAMIQRWSIALAAYDYTIVHRPGTQIPQADCLSRHSRFAPAEATTLVTVALPISREELRTQTRRQLGAVVSAIRKGWDIQSKKRLGPYHAVRDELSIQPDGVLCRADRLVIPPILRKPVLDDLHHGHMGTEKMKSMARQMCWWPGIDHDIRSTARNCQSCLHKSHHRPRSYTPWPETYAPWQRVHMDYCGPFLNHYYALVIIDSYSKWPEVFITNTPTSTFTMQVLRKLFSREGIPQVLVSDNGSHFCATEMKSWLDSIGCRHLRTAPRHPCSNGAAENLVKTLKSALSSASPSNLRDLDKFVDNFLLQYRNAVHATTREVPARLFKGRVLRASLKCLDSTDVTYFRGNDLRPCRGIITRPVGRSMVEITDLDDASVHQRHVDQIRLEEALHNQPDEHIVDLDLPDDPATDADDQTSPEAEDRQRPRRAASQIDPANLREESCGDRPTTLNRYSFKSRATIRRNQTANRLVANRNSDWSIRQPITPFVEDQSNAPEPRINSINTLS